MKGALSSGIALAVVLAAGNTSGAELKFLVGGAMQEPFRAVARTFEKNSGNTIRMIVDTTGALQNRLRNEEAADLVLVSRPGMDVLEREHRIVPGTRSDLAEAKIGVAVKAGAALPDLSSADAFRKTILAAGSVSYVNPKSGGTSGTYMAGLFQRMGIADEVAKKTVYGNQGSEIAQHVARGEAEIGIVFTSEMLPNKGVTVAGYLPDALQNATVYTAAIPVGAMHGDVARAFIEAMHSAEAVAAIKDAGLEPVKP